MQEIGHELWVRAHYRVTW